MRPTWVLLFAVLILASSAETLAAPLVVERGLYQIAPGFMSGTFSGDNFAVTGLNTNGGVPSVSQGLTTGIVVASFGSLASGVTTTSGTIQVGNDMCMPAFGTPNCGGTLTFTNSPLPPPNLQNADVPFMMTGQLVLPNLTVDIAGTGTLQWRPFLFTGSATYQFPEPSTVVLALSGLVALGWSRWRGGKRAGSSRSTATPD
jgi:hypothetical protein